MSSSPTHHRAVALVLTVVLAIGLSRAVRAPAAPAALDAALPAPDAAAPDASNDAPTPPSAIDPNTADLDALMRLPGIGPALARRIVAARDAGVRFDRPDDLRAVRGIGPRTVERLAPFLALARDAATDPPSSADRPAR